MGRVTIGLPWYSMKLSRLIESPFRVSSMRDCPHPRDTRFPQQFEQKGCAQRRKLRCVNSDENDESLQVIEMIGAEGGSRTRTTLRSTDFKSVASAIPPPRHVRQKYHASLRANNPHLRTVLISSYQYNLLQRGFDQDLPVRVRRSNGFKVKMLKRLQGEAVEKGYLIVNVAHPAETRCR